MHKDLRSERLVFDSADELEALRDVVGTFNTHVPEGSEVSIAIEYNQVPAGETVEPSASIPYQDVGALAIMAEYVRGFHHDSAMASLAIDLPDYAVPFGRLIPRFVRRRIAGRRDALLFEARLIVSGESMARSHAARALLSGILENSPYFIINKYN